VVSMINEYINISTLETKVDTDSDHQKDDHHVDESESVDPINLSPSDDKTIESPIEDTKKEN